MKASGFHRVVEELCMRDDCRRTGTHWHPLEVDELLREEDGEYTITIRIRSVPGPRKTK